MIICFNKKINDFNENNLKNFKSHNDQNSYLQSLMPDITDLARNKCPHCKANNKLVKYGTYNRNLSILIDNHIKQTFIKILNNEKYLKHQCWLLLAYCSGLRAEEVAKVKISDIYSNEHKLRFFGKRRKERFTVLPDITIKYLRLYYKYFYKAYNYSKNNWEGVLII